MAAHMLPLVAVQRSNLASYSGSCPEGILSELVYMLSSGKKVIIILRFFVSNGSFVLFKIRTRLKCQNEQLSHECN